MDEGRGPQDPATEVMSVDDEWEMEGSRASFQSIMRNHAAQYLAGYPRRPWPCSEVSGGEMEFRGLDKNADRLQYHEETMKVAESLLMIMGLSHFIPHWTWSYNECLARPDVRHFFSELNLARCQILDVELISSILNCA